jgi:3,4-dihydroxy-2-butanone 4-phosphate synthase
MNQKFRTKSINSTGRVECALEALRHGGGILVVDDEEREKSR